MYPITVSFFQERIIFHLDYLNDLPIGVVYIFTSLVLQSLLHITNRIFLKIWVYNSPSLAYTTHTNTHRHANITVKNPSMISFDHRTKIKTKNKNVFYSTPVSLTSYTNYHIPLQALCSIQNNFLPLTHYFTYSHYSFFTLAISSAFKNFLFLPHEVDSYLLFRFQLSYHFPSYHFFIQLLWLGQIPYYIFIVPLASPSMYFWEPRVFFTFIFEIISLIALWKFVSSNRAELWLLCIPKCLTHCLAHDKRPTNIC